MTSIYELARQRIAERVFGAIEKPQKKPHPSDSHERRRMRMGKWYAVDDNRKKAIKKASKANLEYKKYYGFFPSNLYYYRKKIKAGEMTIGEIPNKYKTAWSDWKNGRKPWRKK